VFCNGAETCSATLGCQAGNAVDCADADICTDDACDEAGDVCAHVFDPTNDPSCVVTACGNGRLEGGEQCDDGNLANGDCCSATCQFESAGSACNDGLFCTTGTTCNGTGACAGGTPIDCSDGVACTTDSCDEGLDACAHAAVDAACADGSFCNGTETCSLTLGCQGGTPIDCDDGIACTTDACDETADACAHAANDAACADGQYCNGAETCNAALGCQAGTAVDCGDGVACTTDTCVEATDSCAHAANDAACTDGQYCNGSETCSATLGCQAGTAVSCDDGIACTADTCDEAADRCAHAADDAACSDDVFCNGVETCSATLGCLADPSFDCADGEICTDDGCDEAADVCTHVFDRTNDPSCAALCPDADGDGYSPATVGCGDVDCDDSDAAVRPGATEACANDKDDDCDGLIDAADGACADVAWSVRPGTLQNAAYAGSPACARCHETQYDTWSRSLHARLLSRPGDAQAAGFPLPASPSIASWGDVLFVVGQKWKTIYVDLSGNLPATQWNYARGVWSPYPGGPYSCGACHTTGYDAAASFVGGDGQIVPGITGAWVEYNVGCEACHGPGADHAASPAKSNINRIALDWTGTGEGVVTPKIRASEVCGQCHARNGHGPGLDPQGRSQSQYNDWKASPHASTLEPTTLSTYCAKCHSPGNARADSEEHYFSYFEPAGATHVACVSCHDPHRVSDERWENLEWPAGGRRDPAGRPAALGRYRGTDDDPATSDYTPVAPSDTNGLCTDCHKTQPGFRRHVDAKPPTTVTLRPPLNGGEEFEVPHAEHVEEGNAECVSCHMPANRRSINAGDVRTHTLRPDETGLGGNIHYSDTCGACHQEAEDCVWCHSDLARRVSKQSVPRLVRPLRVVRPVDPRAPGGH
jgi:hypothetical protein